jgi:hypothetical protein
MAAPAAWKAIHAKIHATTSTKNRIRKIKSLITLICHLLRANQSRHWATGSLQAKPKRINTGRNGAAGFVGALSQAFYFFPMFSITWTCTKKPKNPRNMVVWYTWIQGHLRYFGANLGDVADGNTPFSQDFTVDPRIREYLQNTPPFDARRGWHAPGFVGGQRGWWLLLDLCQSRVKNTEDNRQ